MPLNINIFNKEYLQLRHRLGLILKIDNRDNIRVIIGTFDFTYRLHCMDYWNAFFSDLIYRKWICLVTILFFSSLNLLFIVISIITSITIFLLLLVFPMLFLFIMCYLFLLYY